MIQRASSAWSVTLRVLSTQRGLDMIIDRLARAPWAEPRMHGVASTSAKSGLFCSVSGRCRLTLLRMWLLEGIGGHSQSEEAQRPCGCGAARSGARTRAAWPGGARPLTSYKRRSRQLRCERLAAVDLYPAGLGSARTESGSVPHCGTLLLYQCGGAAEVSHEVLLTRGLRKEACAK
jgi:hypothetical protein